METKLLKIKTLSPIFIWKGEGGEYSKLDYTVKEEKNRLLIEIYNLNKLFNDLEKYIISDDVFEIVNEIVDNIKDMNSFDDIRKYLENKNTSIPFKKYLIRKYTTGIKDFKENRENIKQFIHQNFNYYIPGSSIKGAINTALLYDKLKDLNDENFKELIEKGSLIPNKDIKISIYENRFYISDIDINNSMLDILKIQRFYIYHTNQEKIGKFRFEIYVEGLKPNESIGNLKIKCSNEMFNKIKLACNELSLKICEWEINILNEYIKKAKNNKNVYNELKTFYEGLLNEIKNSDNNTIFLNIGFGGGYLPKTMYILAEKKGISFESIKKFLNTKYKNKLNSYDQFPFTRAITRYLYRKFPFKEVIKNNNRSRYLINYPLGWIKIEEI